MCHKLSLEVITRRNLVVSVEMCWMWYRYGYPDATYLQRVRDELAAKGIVSSHQIDAGDGQTQSLAAAADNDVRASQRASARRRQTTRVNPERPKSTNDVTAYTEFSDHNASDRSARKVRLYNNLAKCTMHYRLLSTDFQVWNILTNIFLDDGLWSLGPWLQHCVFLLEN